MRADKLLGVLHVTSPVSVKKKKKKHVIVTASITLFQNKTH